MKRVCIVAIALFALADGCRPNQEYSQKKQGVFQKYGWRRDDEMQKEVQAAADLCNKLLGSELGHLRVRPSWADGSDQDVPIYVVGLKNLTWNDIVFVPSDERIIVIGRPQLAVFFADHVKQPDDKPRLLAMFLLHEMGHIYNGDNGSYGSAGDNHLNIDATEQKRKEEAADLFAVGRLRNAMADTKDVERFAASVSVSSSLTMFSFNLSTSAVLSDFGGRSRSRFWDSGYTHPNLERRILVMLHELAPTEQSAELLRQFDEDRKNAGVPRILYRKPTLHLFDESDAASQDD